MVLDHYQLYSEQYPGFSTGATLNAGKHLNQAFVVPEKTFVRVRHGCTVVGDAKGGSGSVDHPACEEPVKYSASMLESTKDLF